MSLVCYVPVKEHIKTQFIDNTKKLTNKTEILVNDEDDTIKIVFMRDSFDAIKKEREGVYELYNLRLGIFNNVLYLGSIANTYYKKSEAIIEKSVKTIHQQYQSVEFPPKDI